MAYDGSLIFDTHIDTNGFSNGLSMLQKLSDEGGVLATIQGMLSGISSLAANAISNVFSLFSVPTADISQFGIGGVEAFKQTLSNAMQSGLNDAATAFEQAASAQNIINLGGEITKSIAGGVQNQSTLKTALNKTMSDTRVSAYGQTSQFYSLGLYMAQGVASGINAGANEIATAMQNAVNSALSAAKTAAAIRSPSRVFDLQIGRMFMKGIEEGISYGTKGAVLQMDNAVQSIANASKNTLGKLDFNTASINLNAQSAFENTAWQTALISKISSAAQNASAQNSLNSNTQNGTQNTKGNVNLYMTVNSNAPLSESELTRQAEDFLQRARRKLP